MAVYIINWCEAANVQDQAIYLPGTLNFVADKGFRRETDFNDLRLLPEVFQS